MEENLQRKKLVCIVDDDDNIREIYSVKFARDGFAVVTARDGEEGLSVIKKERPDVILLDIQMPVMDGLEVLRALKGDQQLTKIPVVILSNVDSEEMFQKVGDLGAAQYYLVKSLTDPQKVVDITLEALARQ
ncbi:MAG: response regulator [Candidatus Moranbacteria bacterium]|nr:response regulator [Candidatus Moranbacteria bacterium]